ncbi:MAG: extracellular solute-binding protein [Burkholderiaceae bacterium]|nr:extracellular solute-binding protein [Microbacteriaceae bacterium]
MSLTTRRITRTAAIAVVAALALAACGTTGPAATSASDGDLSMWGLSNAPMQDIMADSITAWNADNPDGTIGIDFFANDAYKTKVRTAIGAGAGPTFIYGWGGGILKSYVDADEVLDLTPYLTENPAMSERYIQSVAQNGVIDGKTYALPNNYTQPVLLYFNKEVFDQVGAEAPKTWDELLALIPVFTEAGIAPLSLGGQSKWPNLMWLAYLVDRIGGPDVFQAILDGKADAWSDPAVIEALTKIQQLVDAGGFIDGFSSIAADTNADQALLYTGRAAMMLHGAWVYSSIKADAGDFTSSGKLGYVPFPAVEGGIGDSANVTGNPSNFWSVSSKATPEQQKIAVDYLANGMLNEKYVDELVAAGAVPVVTGIENKLAASDDADFLTTVYSMTANAPHFQLSWDQALSPAQADAMLTNLDLIFLGQQTPQEFADIMNGTFGQ